MATASLFIAVNKRKEVRKIIRAISLTIVLAVVLLVSLFLGPPRHTAEAAGAVSITRDFQASADNYVYKTSPTFNWGAATTIDECS